MTTDDATGDELERVRGTCVDLGADEEMTELVLASHRHDRTLLDVMVANGDDLRDYVQHKLAVWEAIFNEHEERRCSRRTVWRRDPRGRAGRHRDPGACGRAPADASPGLGDLRPLAKQRV